MRARVPRIRPIIRTTESRSTMPTAATSCQCSRPDRSMSRSRIRLTAWDSTTPTWAIAWAKPGSTRRSDLGGFNEWEPVLIYGRPQRIYHDLRLLPSVANLANGDTGDHPCPKPLTLLRWLLAQTSTGGKVLDPFMGSGTTLRAAKDNGLEAVGIDIDAHFCDIAARRMAQEVLGV